MEVVKEKATATEQPNPVKRKPKSHWRLKIDVSTWHLTTFKEPLGFQPGSGVTGWEAGFLCFILRFTKRI